MENKVKKYKKCPECELNYIFEEEDICSVCKEAKGLLNNNPPRPVWTTKTNHYHYPHTNKKQNEERENKCILLEKMNSLGFKGFFHTADIKNFIEIYKSSKLCSRNYLIANNIPFFDNADNAILDHTRDFVKSCIRFYYREITPTNISAYFNFNQKHPVLMQFKKDLIFDEKAFFCNGNASSYYLHITNSAKKAIDFDWKVILSQGFFSPDDLMEKNLRNAEFLLSKNYINLDHLEKIYFQTEEDAMSVISKVGCDSRFVVAPHKFYLGGTKND